MSDKLIRGFCWFDFAELNGAGTTEAERYKRITGWAGRARGRNPLAFDALTEWILDDSPRTRDKLADDERVLIRCIFDRFKAQNAGLRARLKELEPSGVVNPAVFAQLDSFDAYLSGEALAEPLKTAVTRVFADFSAMDERGVRELIAGSKTGAYGTDGVDVFGYINVLKNCDAGVQWALFMPDMVKEQLKGTGVTLESFGYRTLPAFRFIGKEVEFGERDSKRGAITRKLDELSEYKSGFDYDLWFTHHYGRAVDEERNHDFWGRFMKAGTPVPDGFEYVDFLSPDEAGWSDEAGPPYLRQFAYAVFTADNYAALQNGEGFDVNVMYDVTRNIILGEGVVIPYPQNYWVAEAFSDEGAGRGGFLFSVDLGG